MGTEKFNTGYEQPSQSELEKQNESDWKEYGAFVPENLRSTADEIFNQIGKNPAYFEDLNDEDKPKYIEKLEAYMAISDVKLEDRIKKKKEMCKEIEKLLDE